VILEHPTHDPRWPDVKMRANLPSAQVAGGGGGGGGRGSGGGNKGGGTDMEGGDIGMSSVVTSGALPIDFNEYTFTGHSDTMSRQREAAAVELVLMCS